MKNNKVVILLMLVAITLSGCFGGISVMGLKQDGSKECPSGERVYLYRDTKVGICLNEEVVVFTHCVSELSLSRTDSDFTKSFDIDFSGLKDILTSASLKPEFKNKVIREFASGGELDKARADAIRGCMILAGIPLPKY
ncbi:MAG: hypothetical protein VXV96_10115 [Bdellovibrionota bacterium]|nr:hypothetical protein [Bdellovibrionota bacterium]